LSSQKPDEELEKRMLTKIMPRKDDWIVIPKGLLFFNIEQSKLKPLFGWEETEYRHSISDWLRGEVLEDIPLKNKVESLESTCKELQRKVHELEKKQGILREITKSEIIYEKYKNDLEKKYFGKIVAIDNSSEKIVGLGDNILEAYRDAKKKSTKNTFSFIRVGFTDKL
jgi:hypothetical protein